MARYTRQCRPTPGLLPQQPSRDPVIMGYQRDITDLTGNVTLRQVRPQSSLTDVLIRVMLNFFRVIDHAAPRAPARRHDGGHDRHDRR